MYAATTSVALIGGDVRPVEVQVHVGRQQEVFKLSGLPDTAVREAKDRVRAAVASAGIRFPNRAVTVNLAPADLPKGGTDYDLAIALGVLAAAREISAPRRAVVVGELALDGSVRPGRSTLGAGVMSARLGLPCLVAAAASRRVAAVPGATVHGVVSLADAVSLLRGGLDSSSPVEPGAEEDSIDVGDFSEIRGQAVAKRAMEVAAAGGHHVLLHGAPGGGKTMLARRLPGILPSLSAEESVEVALIHSAAGLRRDLSSLPPFRAPHHTASRAALIGGGSGVPVPGEASLAHNGVLFLDELAEFSRGNLDTLRQPLEDRAVVIARRGLAVQFPAFFQLVAASNPCPCGFYGDRRKPCECRPSAVSRYRQRVSGPLLDRIDLVVRVGRVHSDELSGPADEGSDVRRRRVTEAVEFGRQSPSEPSRDGERLILDAMDRGAITARGADRVRRVARTIAHLGLSTVVAEEHFAEAMALRGEW